MHNESRIQSQEWIIVIESILVFVRNWQNNAKRSSSAYQANQEIRILSIY